ncbi:MAG: tRNA (N(6)-L-threonylcarbamoyladenosine(37)-C(2))-methylthiotransferase MtaB, partial [Gammaproteobacteria bacterium]
MKVNFKTLGCRLNEAELQTWANTVSQHGWSLSDPNTADVIVVNTCAVTAEGARKSRQQIRRLHRDNSAAKLVVTGCYASLEPTEVEQMLGVDLVVDNADKDRLAEQILARFKTSDDMPMMATEPGNYAMLNRSRERAFLKIQDGCRYRCTYCIVTVARGDERSQPIAELVNQVNDIHAQGIHEIVLTGVHVGGYGSDLGSSLYELVQTLLQQTDIPRIRFASVEPWDLPDHFFELFADERLMPHMHLPLQSGADSVLRRMSRRCRQDSFRRIIERARACHPDFNITTDIIVGFPGETDEEWQESLAYIAEIGFSHVHCFSYSDREGTKAARLANKVSAEVKKQRMAELQ